MAEKANSDGSLSSNFADKAAKPLPELEADFKEAHAFPIVNSEFRKVSKAEDRSKYLSKPVPTLTPEGTITVRQKAPTVAEVSIDAARLPKLVKQRQPPHLEFGQVVGRQRHQDQQNERER